jgi:signal transduction histidine kinase
MMADTALALTESSLGREELALINGDNYARETAEQGRGQPRAERIQTLGNLACGIAHDLSNVLTPILLGVEALKGELVSDQARQIVTMVEANARLVSDLADQVLAFARGIEGQRAPINLIHLLRHTERTARQTFCPSIEIRTCFDRRLRPVEGDATQLHQVMLNLVVNARDAMPEGGTLTLSARNAELPSGTSGELRAFIAITVADTGCGIPEALLDKVFEPFFTTKGCDRGTGLGLSTVATVVKAHGGRVVLTSTEEIGTKVIVYFPAVVTE